MASRPKLTIEKKFFVDNTHYRYYSVWYNPNNKQKVDTIVINLEDDGDDKYPNCSFIKTERDLCEYILSNWGDGEYRVFGHLKGKKGFWAFGHWGINEEGFIFLKKEKSNSWEELRGESRYGFIPFLTPSSRRGNFTMWSDINLQLTENDFEEWGKDEEENIFESWGTPHNEIRFEEWGNSLERKRVEE